MNRFRKNRSRSAQEDVPTDLPAAEKAGVSPRRSERPPPQREFKTDAGAPPPSRFLYQLAVSAYWLAPLLVILLILIGGFGTVVWLRLQEVERSADASEEFFSGPSRAPIVGGASATEVLQAHIEAVGGREPFAAVGSLRLDGELDDGEQVRSCQIITRLPDMGMLLASEPAGGEVRRFKNGETAWEVVEAPNGREVIKLPASDRIALEATLRFLSPLANISVNGGGTPILSTLTEFGDQGAFLVRIERSDGSTIDCFLDRESLYLIGTGETVMINNQTVVLEVLTDDHRMTAGIVLPFYVEVRIDGSLHHRISVDSYRVNTGVMSALFDVPEELDE